MPQCPIAGDATVCNIWPGAVVTHSLVATILTFMAVSNVYIAEVHIDLGVQWVQVHPRARNFFDRGGA